MSTAAAVIDITSIDVSKLTVGEVKKAKGLSAPLMYNGQKVQFLLPTMSFLAGVMSRENDNGDVTHSLMGSLAGCPSDAKSRAEGTDKLSKAYNVLHDIGPMLKVWAFENSQRLFGKKRSAESIEDSFNERSIMSASCDKVGDSYVPNGKYPPSFRAKIPVWERRVTTEVLDKDAKPVYTTIESLPSVFSKGISANLVVNGSVYIMGQSFGISWRVTMAQVFPAKRLTAANVFAPVEDADLPESEAQPEAELESQPEAQPEAQPEPPAEPQPSRKKRGAAQA